MEIVMAAIPYNGIGCVFYAMPFALPFVCPFASVIVDKRRTNSISQPHRMFLYVILADKRRIVVRQFRNNRQMTLNDGITSTGCGIYRMTEVSFLPDGILMSTAHDEWQLILA